MDRFDRKLAAYRKAHGMTVPDPTSEACETRQHNTCPGQAWDKIRDQPAPCTCTCHNRRRR